MKSRNQNPVVGDSIRLRMLVYSSNNLDNVQSISSVKIYKLDSESISSTNPDGRVLIEEIPGTSVVNEDTGKYYVDISAVKPKYIVGDYLDIWTLKVEDEQEETHFDNKFTIYSKLWYTSTTPIVYDFAFSFIPNRIPKGSIKPLQIQIQPRVPVGTELERYYTNIAIYSDVYINIAKKCDPCLPCEEDLRKVVEDELIEDREKAFAYYQLDTTEMDCGIYDVWFKMEFGGNTYISDRNQILIY